MATSCFKVDYIVMNIQKVQCPVNEYQLPLYKIDNTGTLELLTLSQLCHNLSNYKFTNKDSKEVNFFAKLNKNENKCHLLSAFTKVDGGLKNMPSNEKELPYLLHLNQIQDFVKLTKLKPIDDAELKKIKINEINSSLCDFFR